MHWRHPRAVGIVLAVIFATACAAGKRESSRAAKAPSLVGSSIASTAVAVPPSDSATPIVAVKPAPLPAGVSSANQDTVAAAPPSAAPKASQPTPSPLPKGTKVLHVGDSMADALGKSLRREFKKLGINNRLKAQEATYIPEWAGYKHGFRGLLRSFKPDLVIITLGGNEVAMPDPSVRARPVRKMVKLIGDTPCLWIAAPLWPKAKHTGVLDVIRQNCAPCIYVDTNKLIGAMDRTRDKIHPTIPERKRWARYMIRWLRYNRDPKGDKPWRFVAPSIVPPPS